MRRLPIYFLIDVSESMVGEPQRQVERGMRDIIQELRTDPYALETAWVSVIAFAGKAKTLTPLSEICSFYPPVMPVGGGTSLGAALDHLMASIDREVTPTTRDAKGDWKPLVFIFTDGTPTDNPDSAISRWQKRYASRANVVAIAIGDNVDTALLGRITKEIVRFNDRGEASYREFFKWVTASIRTSSMSVADFSDENLKLPKVDGINLEKINPDEPCRVDERFVVLLGRCQNTDSNYLIKYRRSSQHIEGLGAFTPSDFRLVGAYPVDPQSYGELSMPGATDRKVNSMELIGAPTCPCCGNQMGLVVCQCGNIFCVGESKTNRCPWCGLQGTLSDASAGFDISRTRG